MLKIIGLILFVVGLGLGFLEWQNTQFIQFGLLLLGLICLVLHFKLCSDCNVYSFKQLAPIKKIFEITGIMLFVIGLSFLFTPLILAFFDFMYVSSRNDNVTYVNLLANMQASTPSFREITSFGALSSVGLALFLIAKKFC